MDAHKGHPVDQPVPEHLDLPPVSIGGRRERDRDHRRRRRHLALHSTQRVLQDRRKDRSPAARWHRHAVGSLGLFGRRRLARRVFEEVTSAATKGSK